ncbi:MAG TPA: hypothetical protein VHT30_08265 [Acidimicrobiales bacterium]|nr:hypothetical protein [Acidimicrobiales bacterium]
MPDSGGATSPLAEPSPWRRRSQSLAAIAVAAAVLVSCSGRHRTATSLPSLPTSTGSAGTTGGTTPGATTEPAAPPGLKPVIRGLIDRNGMPPAGYPINAWVVQVDWSALQPTQGGPIAANNAIDQAIAAVRATNSHGGNMALKLRVYAGINSPDWAKQLGGPPFPVSDSGQSGMSPRFWTPQFSQAYAALQSELAAKYDGVPELREVVISQCTTVFDEPFRRQVPDQASLNAWLAAGYTMAADEACQESEIEAHQVWKMTSSDLALNQFMPVAANQGSQVDLSFPEQVMQYCRQQLGVRCVLENNSLKPKPSANLAKLYLAMQALGPPITFQTASGNKVGDLAAAVKLGAELGAESIELPMSYRSTPPSDLEASLSAAVTQLVHNPAP